jgi:hypothetical protein
MLKDRGLFCLIVNRWHGFKRRCWKAKLRVPAVTD